MLIFNILPRAYTPLILLREFISSKNCEPQNTEINDKGSKPTQFVTLIAEIRKSKPTGTTQFVTLIAFTSDRK